MGCCIYFVRLDDGPNILLQHSWNRRRAVLLQSCWLDKHLNEWIRLKYLSHFSLYFSFNTRNNMDHKIFTDHVMTHELGSKFATLAG